jgi:hypothetical protein
VAARGTGGREGTWCPMTEPWTPGPWVVGEGTDIPGDATVQVATVGYHEIWATGEDTIDEYEADARLIAAAPEMVELLAEVAGGGEHPTDGFPSSLELYGDRMASEILDDIRALLARIRGESDA